MQVVNFDKVQDNCANDESSNGQSKTDAQSRRWTGHHLHLAIERRICMSDLIVHLAQDILHRYVRVNRQILLTGQRFLAIQSPVENGLITTNKIVEL